MWIQIIGATGTGKEHILKIIQKDGYEYIDAPVKTTTASLENEMSRASARIAATVAAAKVKDRRDVVTIRSYYDSRDIFIPIAEEFTQITKSERDLFFTAYEFVDNDFFTPPDVVVYCRATKINAINRAAMRGVEINDDVYNRQAELYAEYVKKIRVPVIELDSLGSPVDVGRNLEFGLASIKAANLSGRSIWEKSMFWTGEVYGEKG